MQWNRGTRPQVRQAAPSCHLRLAKFFCWPSPQVAQAKPCTRRGSPRQAGHLAYPDFGDRFHRDKASSDRVDRRLACSQMVECNHPSAKPKDRSLITL